MGAHATLYWSFAPASTRTRSPYTCSLHSDLALDSPCELHQHPTEQKEHLVGTSPLTILTGIEAREGGAQDFDKVAHASQVLVHIPEVGVDVVTIPEKQ